MDDREELLASALRAEEEGDLVRTTSLLEEIVRHYPDDVRTGTWLGKIYADREQYAAAAEVLQHALAIDDTRARTHAVLAEAFLALGRNRDGEMAARRSVELAPTSASLVVLGYALSAQCRSDDAIQAFRRALEIEADNEEAMYNLALELRRTDPEEALALLKAAVRIDPLYAAGYREYGFLLAEANDLNGAEDALRNAIALADDDSLSHVYLANVLASGGRTSEAEAELRRACQLAPLSALAHWGLAKLYEAEGRYAEAEALFRIAVTVEPSEPEALYQFARFLAGTGRPEEGKEWLDRALAQDPSHVRAVQLKRRLAR
jgi:Tfp pilus assembly protein PilF